MFPGYTENIRKEYLKYLERFDKEFGQKNENEFVKKGNYLIKKLSFDDFIEKYYKLAQLEKTITNIVNNGGTLLDEMNQAYSEIATHLLLKHKNFL